MNTSITTGITTGWTPVTLGLTLNEGTATRQENVAFPVSQEDTPSVLATKNLNGASLLERKLANPKLELTSEESITLISHCIALGEKQAEKARDEDLIVVIGNTGAGKSIFVDFLAGSVMEIKSAKELKIKNTLAKKFITATPEIMPVSHDAANSKTFMPEVGKDQQGRSYCDCPGFLDSRGSEINIANAVNIKNVFIHAKSVKVVILVHFHAIVADKGTGFKNTIKILRDLFGSENLMRHQKSILLGITHIPLATEDEGEDFEDLRTSLKDFGSTNGCGDILNCLIEPERLFIYDLCGRKLAYDGALSKDQILEKLNALEPIDSPSTVFKTVLIPEDEQRLYTICNEIKKRIQATFSKETLLHDDFEEIAQYQYLRQLKLIENRYVDELIEKANMEIIHYFGQMVNKFNADCASGSQELIKESEIILSEIKDRIQYFDETIQNALKIDELQERLNQCLKKEEAKQANEELNALAVQCRLFFYTNLLQVPHNLAVLKEKIRTFQCKYSETKIECSVDLSSLEQLYKERINASAAQQRWEEADRRTARLQEEVKRMEREAEERRQREAEEGRQREAEEKKNQTLKLQKEIAVANQKTKDANKLAEELEIALRESIEERKILERKLVEGQDKCTLL